MNHFRLSLFSSVFLLALNAPIAMANHSSHAFNCPDQTVFSQISQIYLASAGPLAGVSVAIDHPVCGEYLYTMGQADISAQQNMTSDTMMPIASNTKPILIAMALSIMEKYPQNFPKGINTHLDEILDQNGHQIFTADGKIYLTDGTQADLTNSIFYKQLTNKPFDCKNDSVYACPAFNQVDLHHLMMESSGFADFLSDENLTHEGMPDGAKEALFKVLLGPTSDHKARTDLEELELFGVVKKTNPDPIVPMQSHNTDAALLSIILQRTTGQSLNDLLNDYILKPLNLSKDSMHFVVDDSQLNNPVAHRYALCNTDYEVMDAIRNNKLFDGLSATFAQMMSPSFITSIGYVMNDIHPLNPSGPSRQALDVLTIDPQGLIGIPGPGGIVAQPKAYNRFYAALANGTLLSKTAQALYQASFIPISDKLEAGYGSTVLMTLSDTSHFYVHRGFVAGGESNIMYHIESGTSMMITSNVSGYTEMKNPIPSMMVTETPYFGANEIQKMQTGYIQLFQLMG